MEINDDRKKKPYKKQMKDGTKHIVFMIEIK